MSTLPTSVCTVTVRAAPSRATALPRTSSACGHITRRGTTACLGSTAPAATSGSSGVNNMAPSGSTMVAPSTPSSRATWEPPNPPPRINVPFLATRLSWLPADVAGKTALADISRSPHETRRASDGDDPLVRVDDACRGDHRAPTLVQYLAGADQRPAREQRRTQETHVQ